MARRAACAGRRRPRTACRRAATPTRRSARRRSTVRHLPSASKFSSEKPERIHPHVARPRRPGSCRCASIRSRSDRGCAVGAALLQRRHVGRRRRRRRAEHVLEQPSCRAARARCGWDTTSPSGCCAWPSRPPRLPSAKRHAPEVAAVDVRNPIVPGQPLVDERVVGRQQFDHAAVLAQLAADEQLASPAATPRAGSRRTPETRRRRAPRRRACRSSSHWLAKLSTSACERGSREHPPHLLLEHRRIAAACRDRRIAAARRPGCCSRERTTAATRGRDR